MSDDNSTSTLVESVDGDDRDRFGLAYFVLRVGLGINIFVHGASRLGDVTGFASGIGQSFAETFVPVVAAESFAYVILVTELAVGACLIIGWASKRAAFAGGLLMFALIFGINLQQKWETAGLQLVYLWLFAMLVAFSPFDRLAVDDLVGDEDGR